MRIKLLSIYPCIIFFLWIYSLSVNASISCEEVKQDQKALKENPGYYYFHIGLCEFQFIHDKQQFDIVADALAKSTKYDYSPSYFALGLLYDNRFNHGSTWLASKSDVSDLLKSIENYTKAAEHHSAAAENNLGEIYLHYSNLTEKYRPNNDSDHIAGVSKILPNLDSSIYWLERAAKHGHPAAQGTLSDLYARGIGIPQDFVMAYVWQNLSVASQSRYNKNMQDNATGRDLVNSQRLIAKKQYNELTEMQKNASQDLLKEYSKLYFRSPTKLDEFCQSTQSYISGTLAVRYLKVIQDAISKESS